MHTRVILFLFSFFSFITFALAQPAEPGVSPPSDDEITTRIRGNGKDMISVGTTKGKGGELVWKESEKTWYFQRGYLVKRSANLADNPKAILEVGGLAVYRFVNGKWQHSKDLVTFNRYEGLQQPDKGALLSLVKSMPERSFRTDWHRVQGGLQSVDIPATPAYNWHSPRSFSFPVIASYTLKWDAAHTVDCTREWMVRVYLDANGQWGNPSGMHSRTISGCRL